jgi:hypothetical protein
MDSRPFNPAFPMECPDCKALAGVPLRAATIPNRADVRVDLRCHNCGRESVFERELDRLREPPTQEPSFTAPQQFQSDCPRCNTARQLPVAVSVISSSKSVASSSNADNVNSFGRAKSNENDEFGKWIEVVDASRVGLPA